MYLSFNTCICVYSLNKYIMSTDNQAGGVLGPGAVVARNTKSVPRGSVHSRGGIPAMLTCYIISSGSPCREEKNKAEWRQ